MKVIEFSLDPVTFPNRIIGRLYADKETIRHLLQSHQYNLVHSQIYCDGQIVIWFESSLKEYCRLACEYPHHKKYIRSKTQALLRRLLER
jgi:hypothetical protein